MNVHSPDRCTDPPLTSSQTLSEIICWSRMQAEAGQDLAAILGRKELERVAGEGLFCWGVGNAPGPTIGRLACAGQAVDVVFSVMKSRPKAADIVPRNIVAWRCFIDASGAVRDLPPHVLITSRAETKSGRKRVHYALMCWSEQPLELADYGPFDPCAYRNLDGTGAPVGASQVTALLRRVSRERSGSDYRVNIRARLAGGYWVKLVDPVPVSDTKRTLMAQVLPGGPIATVPDWCNFVAELRGGIGPARLSATQPRFL